MCTKYAGFQHMSFENTHVTSVVYRDDGGADGGADDAIEEK